MRRYRSRRARGVARSYVVANDLSDRRAGVLLGVELNDSCAAQDVARPRTRGECAGGARPCPWVGCRHHLFLDVNPETGSIKLNHARLDLEDLIETCSLDVADGEVLPTLDRIGVLLNVTRERVRQLGLKALYALHHAAVAHGIDREA